MCMNEYDKETTTTSCSMLRQADFVHFVTSDMNFFFQQNPEIGFVLFTELYPSPQI